MCVCFVIPRWCTHTSALRHGVYACQVRDFVVECKDAELDGLFGAALRAFAGDSGFLGRHKLKMVGFLEVAFKVGRSVTLGGFAGLIRDRA